MLHVLRTVRALHERLEHHDRDNASAPVCSVTQLDICPSIRENTKMLLRDQHAGGFLHHGNAHRNEIHRTSDPRRKKSHPCACGDCHERTRLACPCVQTSAENTLGDCTLIVTVTGTSVATIQQSASTQNPSFESLEQVLYGCPVVYATISTSRGIASES